MRGRLAAFAAAALGFAAPAQACSIYPPRLYQADADVVVVGKLAVSRDTVMPRRVLKGERRRVYPVVWHSLPDDDECRFLSAVPRDRGVYFLKRREDGAYDVLWTEDRWKMVR
ncbi:hypothetical protein Q9Q95_17830 [Sphingomonas sp. DG1-23]|uniref:hypothetical protein n=1 Tax=Sphingomonas sp. DG1-23 TaxID=3068316 RepID=UPI00273E072F|nr:hypothetical protein [Sphingomonas sp. DG1-23]MDP5280790.1 hypothetical protein [Sphingomonas sp. DG1-23]